MSGKLNPEGEVISQFLTLYSNSVEGVAFQPSLKRAYLFFEDVDSYQLAGKLLSQFINHDYKQAHYLGQKEQMEKIVGREALLFRTDHHHIITVPFEEDSHEWSTMLADIAANNNITQARFMFDNPVPQHAVSEFSQRLSVEKQLEKEEEHRKLQQEKTLPFSYVATLVAQSIEGVLNYQGRRYLLVPRNKGIKDAVLSFFEGMLDQDEAMAAHRGDVQQMERIEQLRYAPQMGLDHHYAIALPDESERLEWGKMLADMGDQVPEFSVNKDGQMSAEEADKELSEISQKLHQQKQQQRK